LIKLENLKAELFRLLKEDEEFRYAIAGLIGLGEVLKRLEEHDKKFAEILKRLEEHDKKFAEVLERLEEHDEKFVEVLKRLEEHDKKFAEIFEHLNAHDEKFVEALKRLDRHEDELVKLREDMNKGFELVNRHISAIGARWGIIAENAFRSGLKGLLEREIGLKVERWSTYDEDGLVFSYPSNVEVDVAVKDDKIILIEVSSHVRASDILQFMRKAELYKRKTGKKPDRLLIVTPYADDKALEASRKLGIEVYTSI